MSASGFCQHLVQDLEEDGVCRDTEHDRLVDVRALVGHRDVRTCGERLTMTRLRQHAVTYEVVEVNLQMAHGAPPLRS
jgi:hypothetical protein